MAGEKKLGIKLQSLDDMFTPREIQEEESLSKIRFIPISEIDEFPGHPFHVRDDEDMDNLMESIRERGVITPAVIRKKEDGRYELISGHRRKRACERLGLTELRCEVVDMDRDEATIVMVESNSQRSVILPSEKAFAYKMRLEAMKRQGKRSDLTSCPVGTKLESNRSDVILAENSEDSARQIQRYIRLTELIPELLELVDEGRIKMRPAVELSYLDTDAQRAVSENIAVNDGTPSHGQAIKLRQFFREGKLSPEVVESIMAEEKPNQKARISLRADHVNRYFPKDLPINKREEYIIRALEHYSRFKEKNSQSRER